MAASARGSVIAGSSRIASGVVRASRSFVAKTVLSTVGFDGWRARPVWNVLVFDAADPPSRRGLVRVDAGSGEIVETYTEEIAAVE